jgi:hypothetical protein
MRAPDARCRACKGVVRRLSAAVSVMKQNGTRQDPTDPTGMTVLAARREGQGTEMSGRGAQQHCATAEAIENVDQMLGRDWTDRHDLMRAQDRRVVWQ